MDDVNAPPSPAGGEDPDDYVFRFPLGEKVTDREGYDDPLLEVVRGLLADLCSTVVLTYKGRRVRVDGFRLLQDPDQQHEIFPGPKAK
jgi:hypothetical protein